MAVFEISVYLIYIYIYIYTHIIKTLKIILFYLQKITETKGQKVFGK